MLLIKNVYLYDPASGTEQNTDLLIDGGKFVRIGPDIDPDQLQKTGKNTSSCPLTVLDAEGLCGAPGLIDTHSHFRDPGYTHKEDLHTGSLSAARGGYTSVILMANTKPVVDSVPVLKDILTRAGHEKIHVYSCANVTQGMKGKETVDFDALAAAGAAGFTDDGVPLMDASVLEKALEQAVRLDLPARRRSP